MATGTFVLESKKLDSSSSTPDAPRKPPQSKIVEVIFEGLSVNYQEQPAARNKSVKWNILYFSTLDSLLF